MPYDYENLEAKLLAGYNAVDNDPAINSVLDYTPHNTDAATDHANWESGTERFMNDNIEVLRA